MKFKIPMEGGDDEINMAPMIDMVFLLLIFFMVASHLTQLDRVPVKLPVAEQAKVPKEARNRQIISLSLAEDGSDDVEITMNLNEVEEVNLPSTLQKLHDENNDLKVYLRADRAVKHKHVKAIMEACSDAGILDIIFGTFESGE